MALVSDNLLERARMLLLPVLARARRRHPRASPVVDPRWRVTCSPGSSLPAGSYERLGQVHGGHFRTPQSNAEYGTGETPLLQENGDPVTDQLYTTGFALLGLHEAVGATGDPRLRRAEDKLAGVSLPHSDPLEATALAERHLVPRLRRPPLGGLGQLGGHRLGRMVH